MDTENVVCMYNGLLLGHKKEHDIAICSDIDRLRGCYAKWNKSDGKRQILYNDTYMWNLEIQQTSEYKRQEANS